MILTQEQAVKILETLVRLWADQHGLVATNIRVYPKKEKTA